MSLWIHLKPCTEQYLKQRTSRNTSLTTVERPLGIMSRNLFYMLLSLCTSLYNKIKATHMWLFFIPSNNSLRIMLMAQRIVTGWMVLLAFECTDPVPILCITLCVKVSEAARGEISVESEALCDWTGRRRRVGAVRSDGVYSDITKEVLHSSNKREMSHKTTLPNQTTVT